MSIVSSRLTLVKRLTIWKLTSVELLLKDLNILTAFVPLSNLVLNSFFDTFNFHYVLCNKMVSPSNTCLLICARDLNFTLVNATSFFNASAYLRFFCKNLTLHVEYFAINYLKIFSLDKSCLVCWFLRVFTVTFSRLKTQKSLEVFFFKWFWLKKSKNEIWNEKQFLCNFTLSL